MQGTATDGVGPIQRIEVSLAGKDDWVPFFPTDGIFDEPQEEFDIDSAGIAPAGPALLAVRVFDDAGNAVVMHVMLK